MKRMYFPGLSSSLKNCPDNNALFLFVLPGISKVLGTSRRSNSYAVVVGAWVRG